MGELMDRLQEIETMIHSLAQHVTVPVHIPAAIATVPRKQQPKVEKPKAKRQKNVREAASEDEGEFTLVQRKNKSKGKAPESAPAPSAPVELPLLPPTEDGVIRIDRSKLIDSNAPHEPAPVRRSVAGGAKYCNICYWQYVDSHKEKKDSLDEAIRGAKNYNARMALISEFKRQGLSDKCLDVLGHPDQVNYRCSFHKDIAPQKPKN